MANMTSNADPMAQNFQDLFNSLSNMNPLAANTQLLSAVLQLNMMWAAIFLVGIYLLWDIVVHYIPIVRRAPLLPSLFSMVWFVSCLLVVLLIYMSTSSVVVKVFGGLFILLLLISFLLTFYRLGSIAVMLYHHRSIAVAMRGPNVVCINNTCYSANHTPAVVTILSEDGKVTYDGNNLGSVDPAKLTVTIYSGRHKVSYETHRNLLNNKLVKAFDRKFRVTTYVSSQEEPTAKSAATTKQVV